MCENGGSFDLEVWNFFGASTLGAWIFENAANETFPQFEKSSFIFP